MYYNHNLRTDLQEWKNRLYKATYEQFGNQLKYCINNIESNKLLSGLIKEACTTYTYDTTALKQVEERMEYGNADMEFENNVQHAAYSYQFLKYLINELGNYNLHLLMILQADNFNATKNEVIEHLITPLFYYFHDSLDKSSSIIYLLEKYKRRTEWFTKEELLKRYKDATKSYEQVLDDDLRLFLFDQGIDYPFSTPSSTSGRADIVGAIDTNDPLVLEIKIVDREKSYGKNRIQSGFTQIVNYANDFNKDVGYLVIFNIDQAEINFDFAEKSKVFPPMLTFNNKAFFFVVINLYYPESASKVGKATVMTVTEADLMGSI